MLSTAPAIDAAIREATADPYTNLPRAIVLAATSSDPALYRGFGGWAQLPEDPPKLEEEGVPIAEDSIYELYSATKVVATVAALQLVEQGELALSDDASKYVPELKDVKIFKGFDEAGEILYEENDTPITVEMLATHTAGFLYFFLDPNVAQVAQKLGIQMIPNGPGAGRKDLVKMPLFRKPGSGFQYGPNIDWLTLVVEAVNGLDLETYFQKNIFGPLGITDISFAANPAQISMAHVDEQKGRYRFGSPDIPTGGPEHFGGAGLRGPAPSYLRFLRALLRGGELDGARILKEETVALMFEDHLVSDKQRADFHAFGVNDQEPFSRKAGKPLPDMSFGLGGGLSGKGLASGRGAKALTWSGMANTYWVIDRERDVAFVVWTNVLPYSVQQIHDLWEKAEVELYKGLSA
ncbi:hypothetical protein JCM10449v2_001656 [Rhodotorula kratochvilovae]